MHVSAFSLKSLTMACLPLMQEGGSVVGLTFDAQFAWPQYDWMGPAKAALEATSRYLARDLGKQNIRCNLISAGPLGSMAAKSIPGFGELADVWNHRSPLGVGHDRPGAGRPRCRRAAVATGSRRPRARSSTSTAACTRWAPEVDTPWRLAAPGPVDAPPPPVTRGLRTAPGPVGPVRRR